MPARTIVGRQRRDKAVPCVRPVSSEGRARHSPVNSPPRAPSLKAARESQPLPAAVNRQDLVPVTAGTAK